MRYFLIVFFVFFSCSLFAQGMVSSDVLMRVLLLKYGNGTGSCTAVSIDDNDYLITARHLFDKTISHGDTIDFAIYNSGRWMNYRKNLMLHENPKIDIAVINLGSNDLKENKFEIGSDANFYLSQDSFFLGFPLGLRMEDYKDISLNNGYPIPFVKKGIIASFSLNPEEKMIFIDGHNNKGFSGGPVVTPDMGNRESGRMIMIGVVSAYVNAPNEVITPFGKTIYNENSGIVVAYATKHVYEILAR